MQISSRFAMAVHIFACIDAFPGTRLTSGLLAASIGTNPVIIRRLLKQLKGAGLLEVARGTGGVTLSRPLSEITFLDIYRAVECSPEEELFRLHERPNPDCQVGRHIREVLDVRLHQVEAAFERELALIRLADVTAGVREKIEQEK